VLQTKGNIFLFVAGNKPQIVGVVKWTGNEWETTTHFHTGPPIIDADIDSEGKYVLFATQNRQLQIITIKTDCSVRQLNYQQREEKIHGKPMKCAFGKDGSKGWVFFATESGHIASWNWENDKVIRLEDYRQAVTDPVTLCMLEVLPLSGNLLVTTQNGAKIISNAGHRSSTNKHNATISGCAISPSGNVVSVSELDQSVRWFSPPGLNQLSAQSFKAPTTVALIENSSDIIIGTGEGLIWKQPIDTVINQADVFKVFAEPVVSLLVLDSHTVVAASRSGRIIRLHLSNDKVDILWHSTGYQKQHKILHAKKNDICWSVYKDEKSTANSIVSILHTRDKEEVILKNDGLFFDVDVARGGSSLCAASNHVQVLQKTQKGWSAVYQRNTLVSHLSFLGNGEMIAVVLGEDPWLEVWKVSKDLPTIAAIDIPENLSCISAANNWIVTGFASGNLMSMQFHEKREKFLKTPQLKRLGVFHGLDEIFKSVRGNEIIQSYSRREDARYRLVLL
jgi:WD40 repeat protein